MITDRDPSDLADPEWEEVKNIRQTIEDALDDENFDEELVEIALKTMAKEDRY